MAKTSSPDWSRIVEQHAERIFRIAYRILGSVHDAEDVSQQVFIEARRIQQKEPIQSWSGLLARVATTRAIDVLRRRREVVELEETDCVSHLEPHHHATASELSNWLRRAVAKLPEQQAAVFTLCYFEQLDRNEVSAILEISVEAVSTTLYKARAKLLQQLESYNGVQ
ncbi:MAG: sigma-70 family RNA polymerase sigma factor [Planctomycetales bacterium]|nr:sigma-70 family RNA polymerase sigma factor [Planctomycetales bacterium]